MMLYKEFTLSTPAAASVMINFLKQNAGVFSENGTPLRVLITSEEKKRNVEQNRFYWGVVLKNIAEQSWVAGKQYCKDVWHEHFARMFGVCDEMTLPNGEIILRRKSTTQMTIGEFSEYLNQVQSYAASELSVGFE